MLHRLRRAGARRCFAAGALTMALAFPAASVASAASSSLEARRTQAEIEKLHAEAGKLQDDRGIVAQLPAYGVLVTAIVALGGLFLTLRQQRNERDRDRAARSEQRDKDRDAQRQEQVRRFDERFTEMLAGLTSETPAVRASAAASIKTYLKPEHAEFHDQVLTLLTASLKFPRDDVADRIVGATFAQAVRERDGNMSELLERIGLDLYSACLQRVDLSGLDLSGCDVISANLHGADLRGAKLRGVRGLKVDLSHARLIGADLLEARMQDADLTRARCADATLVSAKLQHASSQHASFDGARLQETNFDHADLRAATFRGANLNNTFFRGAILDESALRSMLLAIDETWRKARFDPPVRERLERYAAER